jgi:hypothetical protein
MLMTMTTNHYNNAIEFDFNLFHLIFLVFLFVVVVVVLNQNYNLHLKSKSYILLSNELNYKNKQQHSA